MMDFISDLERKVDRMKGDSESAAEELIQLRGHHQSLKKTHQLLSQQVAYYVQMARNQEQLLTGIQQEIVDLKQKRSRMEGGSANGHVTPGEGGRNVCTNGNEAAKKRFGIRTVQLETPSKFSAQEMPSHLHALVDASYSAAAAAPPLSATLMPPRKTAANGVSSQQADTPATAAGCAPINGVSPEGQDGWIDGSSLRGLLSDVFEENNQDALSLTDLFGDDVEHVVAHRTKRTRT